MAAAERQVGHWDHSRVYANSLGAAFPRPPALLVKSLRFIRDCSGSGLFLALAALTPPTTLELFQSLSAPALLRTCNL